MISSGFDTRLTIGRKLLNLNWGLVILLSMLATVGIMALYSAAKGDMDRWAMQHLIRYSVFLVAMIGVALVDIKWWMRLAWPAYFLCFILLVIVEALGHIGMGAQRWINLGFIKLQPSELMKVAVVMALARYFHSLTQEEIRHWKRWILPILTIAAPMGLVLLQPDLGTTLMIGMAGTSILWLAGLPVWLFLGGIAAMAAAIPLAWQFMLHDYQKQRILTFMNPEADPLGSGYHIMQSKIALGSGGIEGKGFMNGSQSRLNFLPEKQTDFIFTLWAEEWGLIGGLFILGLLAAIFLYGILISNSCHSTFSRLLAMGLTVNFSLYAFINIAMVMGLIPVVGAPLPLVSYGGTSMLATMGAFGLILSASIHRDSKLPRYF